MVQAEHTTVCSAKAQPAFLLHIRQRSTTLRLAKACVSGRRHRKSDMIPSERAVLLSGQVSCEHMVVRHLRASRLHNQITHAQLLTPSRLSVRSDLILRLLLMCSPFHLGRTHLRGVVVLVRIVGVRVAVCRVKEVLVRSGLLRVPVRLRLG